MCMNFVIPFSHAKKENLQDAVHMICLFLLEIIVSKNRFRGFNFVGQSL